MQLRYHFEFHIHGMHQNNYYQSSIAILNADTIHAVFYIKCHEILTALSMHTVYMQNASLYSSV